MADHRIAELREREGHQVTLSRRRMLTLARATPCGFATAPLTCTLPFPIKRPGGPVSTETLQHVALFEKCRTFLPKAREVQAAGLHAWYKPISRSEDTVVVIEGKERIMMGSNNYLGLTHHPDVLAAAKSALDRYGSGCTGSRLLNGTLDLHVQLEAELAEFFGKEACVVFSTGYQANLGVVSGLVGRGDLVFLDKLDHASIVDGAKLAFGDTQRFAHGDLAELERRLQKARATVGKMVVAGGRSCSRRPCRQPTPRGYWPPCASCSASRSAPSACGTTPTASRTASGRWASTSVRRRCPSFRS